MQIVYSDKLNYFKSNSYDICQNIYNACTGQTNQPKIQYDYNSNEGFLTATWGPNLWHFLHIVSFNYKVNPTQQDKDNYRDFIYSLRYILPCKYCRDSFTELLQQQPLNDTIMTNRDSLSRYIYELHNTINIRTNKPVYKSYDEVRDFYNQFRSNCNDKLLIPIKQIDKTLDRGCVVPLHKKYKCHIQFIPQ